MALVVESTRECRRHKTRVQSLGQEDPWEEEMATHFSILAWKIPWTEKPGGLQSMGSQRVRCDGMRLPPLHEMRPDSPALHAEQLRFPNQTHKEPRFA